VKENLLQYLVYLVPLALVWAIYSLRHRRRDAANAAALADAREAGLLEPASLHPLIDPNRCLGCGACITACPEAPAHQVLGLIAGKAQLVSPTDCIGHGACRAACPTDAITLVFGTETRGVTIPVVSPSFESSVPGVFIAGELGGMGLIRNALMQGRQAIEAIHERRPRAASGAYDVIIVGAGPAGFGAALTAKSLGLNFLILEQDSLGGCVFQYPRGKLVMTSPAELPIVGRVKFSNTSKEELLAFWSGVEKRLKLPVHYQQRVQAVEPAGTGFIVRTASAQHQAASVLLAIGRRGTPRKLGIPGEDLPKVVYRLIDPEQYGGQRVLVVGGGDSALEAAASIVETGNDHVTLSYRGDAFGRAKARNRQRVDDAIKRGALNVMLNSQPRRVDTDAVMLEQQGKLMRLPNDAVIVNAGGVLPDDFLRAVGIEVATKYGTA
jgi:thioredoxin reductase/ferredoxin